MPVDISGSAHFTQKRTCAFRVGTLLLALLLALLLLFTACTSVQPSGASKIELKRDPYEMPEVKPEWVTLYYPSEDKHLLAFSQEIGAETDGIYETIMNALLLGTPEGYKSVFPRGIVCRSLLPIQNILYIDMSWQLAQLESEQFFQCVAVLAATFTALPGVDFINITVEGHQLVSPENGVPIMLLSKHTGALSELWSYFGEAAKNNIETFYACVYSQDESGRWLLPHVTNVTARNGERAEAILSAMIAYPGGIFDENVSLDSLSYNNKTNTLSIKLVSASDWTAPQNWLAPQASVCALGCIYPECAEVKLSVTDASGDEKYSFCDETAGDYGLIRSCIDIITPDSTGKKLAHGTMLVSRMPGRGDLKSFVREYICTLDPTFRENDHIVNDAILNDDTVIIDLGSDYFDRYNEKKPDAQEEYAVVYSLVATVCAYSGAYRVMLLEDRQTRTTFAGSIALDRPLLGLPETYMESLK